MQFIDDLRQKPVLPQIVRTALLPSMAPLKLQLHRYGTMFSVDEISGAREHGA